MTDDDTPTDRPDPLDELATAVVDEIGRAHV